MKTDPITRFFEMTCAHGAPGEGPVGDIPLARIGSTTLYYCGPVLTALFAEVWNGLVKACGTSKRASLIAGDFIDRLGWRAPYPDFPGIGDDPVRHLEIAVKILAFGAFWLTHVDDARDAHSFTLCRVSEDMLEHRADRFDVELNDHALRTLRRFAAEGSILE